MRRVVTTAPGLMEVQETDDPVVGPEDALIAVEAVGICGSDIHLFTGDHPYARFPNVQGLEFGGRVLSLPATYAGPVRVGQRVVVEPLLTCGTCLPCRRGRGNCCVRMRTYGAHVDGALTERLAVRASLLHEADDLPPELVVLVDDVHRPARGRARSRGHG